MTSLIKLWSKEDGAVKAHRHWGLKRDFITSYLHLSSSLNHSTASANPSQLHNISSTTTLPQHLSRNPCSRNRGPEVTTQGSQVRGQGVAGLREEHGTLSHISGCCSLIPTASYYNAQMDADTEPSKAVLGTVPACNLLVWQSVCGLQWLHSRATCRHHELLPTRAPHQELRLHGGRRCAHPTTVQPHTMVPHNWWQWQHHGDARSHQLPQ